jgi:hypothetical protein
MEYSLYVSYLHLNTIYIKPATEYILYQIYTLFLILQVFLIKILIFFIMLSIEGSL